MSARALMVLGTASHVGKSLLTTALCRILKQDGVRVAPFKAQNMSLNSAATPEGGEIGRAQALQAEAAGVAPSVDMNPILLKPMSDRRSQVIVRGRIWDNVDAFDYHRRRVEELFPIVLDAYGRLAERYDAIVLEGAGSPAEVNLRAGDLVNMRMAHAADARCILVGDIERGGVFASLVGTMALLERDERARVDGFVVNKFRGDPALFTDGVQFLEERLERRCFGVVPYLRDIGLEEEDAASHDGRTLLRRVSWVDADGPARRTRIAIVAWPLLANFTDFDAPAAEPSVELVYAETPAALTGADLVVLPGTKATLAAMRWLDTHDFVPALRRAASTAHVFGICGGMQALGARVADPLGVEGGGEARGLALLPIETTLAREKIARRTRGRTTRHAMLAPNRAVTGYEIHVGQTGYAAGAVPFAQIVREGEGSTLDDGAVAAAGRVAGTYLHGIFAEDEFRHGFLAALRRSRNLTPAATYAAVGAERERRIDRLAAHVRASLDVRTMFESLVARR